MGEFTKGPHSRVEGLEDKDVNKMVMVRCNVCRTHAHAFEEKQAIEDMGKQSCNPNCENCDNLNHSTDNKPGVPINGSCNDRLHVCPIDGNRWWQFNTHFHLWKQVTNDREWESLQNEE